MRWWWDARAQSLEDPARHRLRVAIALVGHRPQRGAARPQRVEERPRLVADRLRLIVRVHAARSPPRPRGGAAPPSPTGNPPVPRAAQSPRVSWCESRWPRSSSTRQPVASESRSMKSITCSSPRAVITTGFSMSSGTGIASRTCPTWCAHCASPSEVSGGREVEVAGQGHALRGATSPRRSTPTGCPRP